MVYTRSMFTALLALGAVSSVVVVSAVPIDTNSGPSLVTTSSTTSAHTPTSTSVSNAAVPKALLDDPSSIDSDNVLPGVAPLSPPSDRVPLLDRHQRRAPSAGAVCGENSASASTNGQTNGVQPEANGYHNTNGNHAQTGQGPSGPHSLIVSLPIRQGPSRDDFMSSSGSGGPDQSFAQGLTSTSGGANRPSS
ncbi:hypothetical protein EV361DRAFT_220907 [Lentinula raphanica]|nr:hypothetical protein EV361DRAFT_220907 [Lentinula raphanica]